VLPAQQGLAADELAAGDVHLRLVRQGELFRRRLQRRVQRVFDALAALHPRRQRLVEGAGAVAFAVPAGQCQAGRTHGLIQPRFERLRGVVAVQRGVTAAAMQGHAGVADAHRSQHLRQQRVDMRLGGGCRQRQHRQQHLTAPHRAQPAERLHRVVQALRRGTQQHVDRLGAGEQQQLIGVGDFEQQHRHRAVMSGCPRGELRAQPAAVEQAGDGVMAGQIRDVALLRLHALLRAAVQQPSLQRVADAFERLVEIERLEDDVQRPGVQRRVAGGAVGLRRQHDAGQVIAVGQILLQPAHHL